MESPLHLIGEITKRDHHLETPCSFADGVSRILSRWAVLHMAVEKEWGGIDSSRKSQDLASAILLWFSSHSDKVHDRMEELESLLHERMLLSFDADVEDGSIEEVAEELMLLYEDCLHGKYSHTAANERA